MNDLPKGLPADTLHENNFMPLDCILTARDYIEAFYIAVEHYKKEYIRLVRWVHKQFRMRDKVAPYMDKWN